MNCLCVTEEEKKFRIKEKKITKAPLILLRCLRVAFLMMIKINVKVLNFSLEGLAELKSFDEFEMITLKLFMKMVSQKKIRKKNKFYEVLG